MNYEEIVKALKKEQELDAVSLFSIFAIGYVVLIICHDGGCTW